MIEVEKKFHLTKEDEARLISSSQFIGEKTFTDVYYDTLDYVLTTNDKWLRLRNDKFELKISLNKDVNRAADQYDELEDEDEIRKAINLSGQDSLREDLAAAGYSAFCTCTTTRKKYKKGEFGIDLDEVTYGNELSYRLAEIELMVNDAAEMDSTSQKIIEFAKEHGLNLSPVGGKVHYYIKNKMPEHFAQLVKLGILRDV